jgi:hypothetical protein
LPVVTSVIVGVDAEVLRRHGDDVAGRGVGADLEDLIAGVGADHGLAVEGGAGQHAPDLGRELLVFLVERRPVVGGVGGVAGLNGEFAHALQRVTHL